MLRLIPALFLLPLPQVLAEPTYRLFVTNEAGDSVTVIDTRTGEVERTVDVGDRPRGIGFGPGRERVYVALGNENAIGVINTETLELESKIPAGSDPEAFAVHPNGTIYLSNEDEGLATALDPETGKTLAEIKVGLEPEGVGVSPDGKQVLVTSESSNMVHVISVADNKIVANILVGARPREVAFSPDGRFFLGHFGGSRPRFEGGPVHESDRDGQPPSAARDQPAREAKGNLAEPGRKPALCVTRTRQRHRRAGPGDARAASLRAGRSARLGPGALARRKQALCRQWPRCHCVGCRHRLARGNRDDPDRRDAVGRRNR